MNQSNNIIPRNINYGNLEIVKILMTNGNSMRIINSLDYICNCPYIDVDTVRFLVANNCNVRIAGEQALKNAVKQGDVKIVRFLVANGAYIDLDNNICLTMAIKYGNFDVIKFIIKHGINNQHRMNKSLITACIHGDIEIVEYLIAHGANIQSIDKKRFRFIEKARQFKIIAYLKRKFKIFYLWNKVKKSIIKTWKIRPKSIWQKTIDQNQLQNIIIHVDLCVHRKNYSLYSSYLLKVQLAIQMTLLQSVPLITYNHIDCNNLNSPICYDISTMAEDELIKDENNNWYHITDLLDEYGNWKMSYNPYTKNKWHIAFIINSELLEKMRKNYIPNKLLEIHELKADIDIHLNAVRTIMIELDRSTNSNHLDLIDKIDVNKLIEFFKNRVVNNGYFRNYTSEEISVMKNLSGYELLHKFLVITRTIMTDVNLSTYIGQFINPSLVEN